MREQGGLEGGRVGEEGGIGQEGAVVDSRVRHEMEELCTAKAVRYGQGTSGQELILLQHKEKRNDNEHHAPGDRAMALFYDTVMSPTLRFVCSTYTG